jgi:hypothetical protein
MKAKRVLQLVGTARCAVRVSRQRLTAIHGRRSAAALPARARREIFVLTSEEKRTVCFVLLAFVLGLATKFYRDAHPSLLPKPDIKVRGHASPHRPKL